MAKKFLPVTNECFVCGRKNPSGLNLMPYIEEGVIKADFVSDESKMGYRGVLHGGIICTLLDEVMGWAPAYIKKQMCMLADLQVRFVESIPIGTPVTVIGEFSADRRRVWEAKGKIIDKEGKLYARATGKYIPIPPKKTKEIDEDYLIYAEGDERIFSS
ncbi:MAG: PaaI family thioesterase [Deltaproteobacteria bacterium]|nr:MAG: PaaI family thioesterase [Deltaproteobacteria bacterium]